MTLPLVLRRTALETWAVLVALVAALVAPGSVPRRRLAGDRGEGVISTAIAVLIVAFLGAGAYVAFQSIFDGATSKTTGVVDGIGS
jgi:hypothetical protein